MTREQALNYLKSSGMSKEQIQAIVEALSGSEIPTGSTTKNDLVVDCVSRDSVIKALDYDIESFEFKSGVSKHMDDIAKLLNTIYEIQVNNIKALPSVTPQIDYKAQYERLFQKAEIVISQLRADRDRLMSLSSVTPQEPQTFKWCTDCREYDQEKHCCHRWSKVIRNTVEEMKQEYIEREVLDKISAEIKALSPEPTAFDVVDGNPIKDAVWETLADVLQIIDKYKGESEEI